MLPSAPTPETLNWLAKGRLADRYPRAIRLWVILQLLYAEPERALSQSFRYADVRDRLFAPTHGKSDSAKASVLSDRCTHTCRCQQPLIDILEESKLPRGLAHWKQKVGELTAFSPDRVEEILQQHPFATVHRSIREDLACLVEMGWIENKGQGRFVLRSDRHHPPLPLSQVVKEAELTSALSVEDIWEVVRSLESIAFVKPNLEVVIQTLWEQIAGHASRSAPAEIQEPVQRIFVHLDYILSEKMQERVDTLQEQIEQLWKDGGGNVQFEYEPKSGRQILVTVHPVCLHYSRRAKYLSAYGQDPSGHFGWHNYRLDRIVSPRLTLMNWQHPCVPSKLKELHKAGKLPTPKTVSEALDRAWGFNFYLPRKLLIMRFSPSFAKRYVQDTERHPTFEPIAYSKLPKLIEQAIKEPDEQAAALSVLAQKNNRDKYYRAWIRLGDINVVMRLRDWRPKGEVIAPVELRRLMYEEAQQECLHYEK